MTARLQRLLRAPFLMLCLGAIALLVACSSSSRKKGDKLTVLCTTLPVYCLAAAVAGDAASVELLPDPSVGPHSYQFTLSDRKRAGEADVILMNGLSLEPRALRNFIGEIEKGGGSIVIRVADALPPQRRLKAPADENDGHDHGEYDPHVWLCSEGVRAMLAAIRDGLCKADPDNAQHYRANHDAAAAALDKAWSFARSELAPFGGRKIVTFHEAFGYFGRELGLEVLAITVAGEPTSFANWNKVCELARTREADTIFVEPQFDTSRLQAKARESGLAVAVLDPIETTGASLGSDVYEAILRANIASLKSALQKSAAQ